MRCYPKKLIYVSNGGYDTKAILVSSPYEYDDITLEIIELGDSAFEDKYRQVAAAYGARFIDINDIEVIETDQPTNNEGKNDKKQ